jgi:hypothetical protein
LSSAQRKLGVPINVATNPIPWLTLFAKSSLGNSIHFGKANCWSTAVITRMMESALTNLQRKNSYVTDPIPAPQALAVSQPVFADKGS